ncbi:MAG: 8-amino-7-oxononanoate synthase [Rhodocyclaceae bacterium]|nr:8-amino-7-oxononanoate synthase [Rhodocyclaceae bacterium]
MPIPDFSHELARLDEAGLRRHRRVLESAQGVHVTAEGREWLSFCSNDYLGLAAHPALANAAAEAARNHGVGSGASALVSGHHRLHQRLEERLHAFMGRPCLLLGGGFPANTGILPALVGREDAIFADKLVHASLLDGAQLSRAQVRRFHHNDIGHLENLLRTTKARRKLIVVDGVFSMDGDIAPLPELLRLAETHDAWLYVDDAHGFGVLGANGRGTPEHFGLASPRIIHLCTLGKAAGAMGAALFAEQSVVDWLLHSARSYVFSTAPPPLLAAALLAAVDLIEQDAWRREHLQQLIARLRQGAADLPWKLLPSETPIQPLMVGDNKAAVHLAEALRERGIWVPAIRPPTVPKGTARLRLSLSAAHSMEDMERLLRALHEVAGEGKS